MEGLKDYNIFRDDMNGEVHIGGIYAVGGTVVCGEPEENLIEVARPNNVITCPLCIEHVEAISNYLRDKQQAKTEVE